MARCSLASRCSALKTTTSRRHSLRRCASIGSASTMCSRAAEQHRRRRDSGAPGRRGDGAQIGGQIGGGDAERTGGSPPARACASCRRANDPSSPIDARTARPAARARRHRAATGELLLPD